MAINKVELGGNTLIDITDTTATPSDVANGEVFYNADGTRGVGTMTFGNAKIYYGTSSTGASTQAKTVTCTGYTLETGNIIFVKFTNANSYNGTATLSVNSTTAKDIATVGDTKTSRYYWKAGEIVGFIYDGTNYVMIEQGNATTTYYGVTKLSSSTSSTSEVLAATPKAVKTAYDLANGKQDALTFDTTPSVNSTNPVTSGGIYSKLYNDYISYSSWDTTNYVYSVSNKSSVANLLAVDTNNKVRIGNLPTTNSITDDSSTIPKTNAVYSALSSKADTSSLSTVATSGNYNDLTNKPTIPTVPTTLSSFTDDLGSSPTHTHSQYLTSFTETDPVFSASASSGITSTDISNWNSKQDEITSTNKLDYSLLDNTPTIPTVNDGKLTIGRNGTKINDFTANSSTDVNVDISVPVEDVQINGTSILSSGTADIKTNGTYNSSTNKIATMSDVPSDTGWKNLTATKGTWTKLRYRKFGNMVQIEGRASSLAWSGTGSDSFGTLPTGYRPADVNQQFIIALAGSRIARLYVTTAGDIGLDWSINVSNGSNYTSANWYQFNVSYFVD